MQGEQEVQVPGESHMGTYNRVILALGGMTALEFVVAYAMKELDLFTVGVLVLLTLAGWKAWLVARAFMHLKYDPRLLAVVALTPVVLATPLVALVVWDLVTVTNGTAMFGS